MKPEQEMTTEERLKIYTDAATKEVDDLSAPLRGFAIRSRALVMQLEDVLVCSGAELTLEAFNGDVLAAIAKLIGWEIMVHDDPAVSLIAWGHEYNGKKLLQLTQFCTDNEIGSVGDSCVDAVIEEVKRLRALHPVSQ